MENLKSKLKEKNEEYLVLQKSNKSLKDALNRHEKDKNALQNRLKRYRAILTIYFLMVMLYFLVGNVILIYNNLIRFITGEVD